MDRRAALRKVGLVLAVVLVLVALFGAVRIADPFWQPPQPIDPAPSDSPERQVYAALENTERANFVVSRTAAYEMGGTGEMTSPHPVDRITYDNRDREALGEVGGDNDGHSYYSNPYGQWFTGAFADSVGTTARPPDRFHQERTVLECGCVDVLASNESTLVARAPQSAAALSLYLGSNTSSDPTFNATLTVVVDRQQGTLRRSTFVLRGEDVSFAEGNQTTARYVERYDQWGEAEVERPSWAEFEWMEVYLDLRNVERRRWVGEESWETPWLLKVF